MYQCHNYPFCYQEEPEQRMGGFLFPFIGGLLIGGLGGYVVNKSQQPQPYYPYPPQSYNMPYPTYQSGNYSYPYTSNGFYHY